MARKNGILGWFKFESRKQREKRERTYYGRMFPYGEEQKEWEVATLKELFPDRKKRVQELHFALLTLRENLFCTGLNEEDEDYMTENEAFKDWLTCDITRQLVKQGIAPTIYAMAVLENDADSVENFPTPEAIREKAEASKEQFGTVKKR